MALIPLREVTDRIRESIYQVGEQLGDIMVDEGVVDVWCDRIRTHLKSCAEQQATAR